jgi:hypothetical protein
MDHTAAVPPTSANLLATATVTTTGGNTITISSHCYVYGLTFSAGSGATTAGLVLASTTGSCQTFVNCAMKKPGTSGSSTAITVGVTHAVVEWINTTVTFGSTSDKIDVSGIFKWSATASAISGATIPAILISLDSTLAARIYLDSLDLSAMTTSGQTVFGGVASRQVYVRAHNVWLGAGAAAYTDSVATTGFADILFTYSGATKAMPRGIFCTMDDAGKTETSVVATRSGGATDGTTDHSWKITTTSSSSWKFPHISPTMAIWNSTTGSNVTVTVYGNWTGGSVPTNADIWMEVKYFGSSTTLIGTIDTSNRQATPLHSSSNQGTDGVSTWTGGTTAFKMSVTLSSPKPSQARPIEVVVKSAKASTTFYIDPIPVLS